MGKMKIIFLYILNFSLIIFAVIPQLSGSLFNNIYNSKDLWLCNPIWTFLCAWQFSLGTGALYYLICHGLVCIQIIFYAYIFTIISMKFHVQMYRLIYVLFVLSIIAIIPVNHDSVSHTLRFRYWSTI